MNRFSAIWSDELKAAILAAAPASYHMELNRSDAVWVIQATSVPIDSHLEACFVPARGDKFKWVGGKLVLDISREALAVLIRRLMSDSQETDFGEGPHVLACDICTTLDIELI